MPKITEQPKKPVKKVQLKQEIQKPVEVKPEPKVVVFRLFECLVHLEVALVQVKQVGIFPGPEKDAEDLKTRHTLLVGKLESLYHDYKVIWGALPKP